MRILLIFPKRTDDPEPSSSRTLVSSIGRPLFRLGETNFLPPLSLMMIAAVTPPEHDVVFLDERFEEVDYDHRFDLVGITVSTEAAPRAYRIADEFRRRGVPVVLGGIHPSVQRNEAAGHADIVVIGEGEAVWPTILLDVMRSEFKKFYFGGHCGDLDLLPWPKRSMILDQQRYLNIKTIAATRGCENTCSFCSNGLATGKRFRMRNVKDVLAEIDSLPGKYVLFVDDNLGWDPPYAKALLKELRGRKLKWFGQMSMNALEDDELVGLLAESGCLIVDIGFESVSPETITAIHKNYTNNPQKYRDIITRIHHRGVAVLGNFIVGFDTDRPQTFAELADFIREMSIELPNINILIPYPGSGVYKTFQKESRLFPLGWEYYDETPPYLVYRPAQLSPSRLLSEYFKLVDRVHAPSASLQRVIQAGTWKSVEILLLSLHHNFIKRSILRKESLKATELAAKFS